MTSSHFLFIPVVAILGMLLGFIIGARVAKDSYVMELKRDKEREAVRAERAEKKAERDKKRAALKEAAGEAGDSADGEAG